MQDILPLVSVIIPVYNAEKHIEATINSVLRQTYLAIEIIAVNDASTDNSLGILERLGAKIKLINKENQGAGAARNAGIQAAKGKYLQFLDADDMLSENKISEQVAVLESHDPLALAVCSTIHFPDETDHMQYSPSKYEDSFLFSTKKPLEFLINLWGGNSENGSMIQTNAWLIPKTIIEKSGPWQTFYSPDDDGEFFSRVILASNEIIFTPNCYNYYRKSSGVSTLSDRSSRKSLEGCYKSVKLKRQALLEKTTDKRAYQVIGRQLIDIAIKAYPQHTDLVQAIEHDLEELGPINYTPSIGGKFINLLVRVFGWKLARRLQIRYQNLR